MQCKLHSSNLAMTNYVVMTRVAISAPSRRNPDAVAKDIKACLVIDFVVTLTTFTRNALVCSCDNENCCKISFLLADARRSCKLQHKSWA